MRNAFLIVRAIFFTLIIYFNLLAIIFAGCNIVISASSGMPVPGPAAFLMVNAALIFTLITLAYLAASICPRARPAHVRFECGWTVLMGILHLSASIHVTTAAPPALCHSPSAWTVCASAALLMPISWFATFIMLAYGVSLCVMAITHAPLMPKLWTTPVSMVSWFNLMETAVYPVVVPFPLSENSSAAYAESDNSCNIPKNITETWEKLSGVERCIIEPSKTGLFAGGCPPTRPAWANQLQLQTRRGVDQPFSTRGLSPSGSSPKVPSPPPKAHATLVSGPKDFKSLGTCRELLLARTLTLQTPSIFPTKIADPDQPIPRPRFSQWIPAYATNLETGFRMTP